METMGVFVKEDYRAQGLGKLLLQKVASGMHQVLETDAEFVLFWSNMRYSYQLSARSYNAT